MSATEESRKRECPSRHVSHPVSLSAACPVCQRTLPPLPHGFYLSVSRWVFDAAAPPPPPPDVVLSTPRALSLRATLGGFMVDPDLPLTPFRSILKTGNRDCVHPRIRAPSDPLI